MSRRSSGGRRPLGACRGSHPEAATTRRLMARPPLSKNLDSTIERRSTGYTERHSRVPAGPGFACTAPLQFVLSTAVRVSQGIQRFANRPPIRRRQLRAATPCNTHASPELARRAMQSLARGKAGLRGVDPAGDGRPRRLGNGRSPRTAQDNNLLCRCVDAGIPRGGPARSESCRFGCQTRVVTGRQKLRAVGDEAAACWARSSSPESRSSRPLAPDSGA